MDSEVQRRIASKGGKAAHKLKKAHEFSSEQAIVAGKKGGTEVFRRHGSEHMSKIGKRGGHAKSLRGFREEEKNGRFTSS